MLRFLTAGESHGPGLTAIVEGLPAGVPLTEELLAADLARRQRGYGRGDRMQIEMDRARITGGVRHGVSLGGPVALWIENRDWARWQEEMAAGVPAEGWESQRPVKVPRPGHADLAGAVKYRQADMRNILERASARETAARVAVGAVCRAFLQAVGIRVVSAVVSLGGVYAQIPEPWSEETIAQAEQSELRCPDAAAAAEMMQAIDRAREAGDTLGGVFEVRALGVPPGLGSHVNWDRRLDGRLAGAVMSIPAIKGVEVGLGFAAAHLPGSQVHDPIHIGGGPQWPFVRSTNRAGGIEGGMTNGEPVVVRAAMKPIPTLTRPLPSVRLADIQPAEAHAERSDVCAVPAAAVVGEAMVCVELARATLEKFGGDHLADTLASLAAYRKDWERLWGAAEGE